MQQRRAVDLIITADDAFGDPWSPDGHCLIVKRSAGFTLWARRIDADLVADDVKVTRIKQKPARWPSRT